MAVTQSAAVKQISEAKDQKAEIFKLVGDLADIDVFSDLVLLAVSIRPERTSAGLFLPDSARQEDVWQGKAGVVLKCGPDAFRIDNTDEFYEQRLQVGDWGVFKVGDAWRLDIRGVPCRLVKDVNLRLRVKDPSIIF